MGWIADVLDLCTLGSVLVAFLAGGRSIWTALAESAPLFMQEQGKDREKQKPRRGGVVKSSLNSGAEAWTLCVVLASVVVVFHIYRLEPWCRRADGN